MIHIVDNLFLSNLRDAMRVRNEVDIVVRLSEDCNKKPIFYDDIEFYNFELEDNLLFSKEIIEYSKTIYDLIKNNQDKRILIHCNEGRSRSVSVIIYYICSKYHVTYEEAFEIIKKKKHDICPNDGFIDALRKLFNPGYVSKYYTNLDDMLNQMDEVTYLSEDDENIYSISQSL